MFAPLRLPLDTKDEIMQIVSRVKPDTNFYYYAAILAEKTVVSLIKNDPKIVVIPADIQLLFTYIESNEEYLRDHSPSIQFICLPGMTEAYKLPVYIHIDEDTSLRTVFVCDLQYFNPDESKFSCKYKIL
jgi:hypothetical protein